MTNLKWWLFDDNGTTYVIQSSASTGFEAEAYTFARELIPPLSLLVVYFSRIYFFGFQSFCIGRFVVLLVIGWPLRRCQRQTASVRLNWKFVNRMMVCSVGCSTSMQILEAKRWGRGMHVLHQTSHSTHASCSVFKHTHIMLCKSYKTIRTWNGGKTWEHSRVLSTHIAPSRFHFFPIHTYFLSSVWIIWS